MSPATDLKNWQPRFWSIWIGQAFSLVGSALTQFVMVWWITQTTGSATALATASIAAMLPQALLGPLAGTLVDRWNRRLIMIVADSITAACILVMIALFQFELVEPWHLFVLMAIRSAMQAFQQPAAAATGSLLVPEAQLARVAGLNQMLFGLMSIASAPLGALVLGYLPVQSALMIDVVTALIGIAPLVVFSIPQPPRTSAPAATVWQDFVLGLRFVKRWPGMVLLIGLAAIMTMVMVPSYALQPLFVRNEFGGGINEVALIETLTGIGMIVGGLLLGAWGGFKRRIVTVLIASIGLSIGQIVTGAAPAGLFWLAVAGGFLSGFTISLLNGPIVAIFQTAIPADMQGRVLGLFNSVISLVGPIGLVFTGPLADAVGIRTVYVAGGLIVIAVVLIGFLLPALMTIEEQPSSQPVALTEGGVS